MDFYKKYWLHDKKMEKIRNQLSALAQWNARTFERAKNARAQQRRSVAKSERAVFEINQNYTVNSRSKNQAQLKLKVRKRFEICETHLRITSIVDIHSCIFTVKNVFYCYSYFSLFSSTVFIYSKSTEKSLLREKKRDKMSVFHTLYIFTVIFILIYFCIFSNFCLFFF